jgi:hypothetical protein
VNKLIIIKLLSGLINILTCLIAATIVLYRQDWFGTRDTYAFIFWTLPLAIGLAVTGKTIINLFKTNFLLLRLLFIILTAGLLSFGWAYCVALVLGPWIGAFSIPILYLWIAGSFLQLLFLDWHLPKLIEKPKTSKIIFGLLAFPLTLIIVVIGMYLLSFLSSNFTRPEKETYLIPNDFEGEFRVIYGEKCGINPPYENGRRLLQIPENGILIIQPKCEDGIIDHEYYLIDKNGNRKKIKMLWDYKHGTTEAPGVLLDCSGTMGGAMPDGSFSSESPLAIHFTDFTVFNKDPMAIDNGEEFKLRQQFDSLTNAFVNKCRKKNGL